MNNTAASISPPRPFADPPPVTKRLSDPGTTGHDGLESRLTRIDFITLVDAIAEAGLALPVSTEIRLYQDWIRAHEGKTRHLFVAWFNLGAALARAGDTQAAITAYTTAWDLNPAFAPAAINLGLLREAAGETDAALKIWDHAIQINDSRTTLLNHKARLLEQLGRLDEAEATLHVSLLTMASQPDALQHWLHIRQKTCHWPVLADKIPGVPGAALPHYSGPLALLALTDDIAQQSAVTKSWIERKFPPAPAPLSPSGGYQHDRIRIGYLSSDFCRHAMSYLVPELFERHDRNRFEVFGYCSTLEDGSAIRRRILASFDQVRLIRDLSDDAAARQIRDDEIDILIDLNGLTAQTRLSVLRWRPAPVQASWLGFIGPLPLPELNYLICDDFVIPPEHAGAYQPVPLSVGPVYQINDSKRETGQPMTRPEVGLPENQFVFCCFSNHYKITEPMFAAWMTILARVPDALLWLAEDNAWSHANLHQAAARAGIAPERIIFAPRISPEAYLSRLALADLYLDTFPYNAGTVASDAIRMGLPIVTLCGKSFAARMAGSLLRAVGADDGIATDLPTYIERAIAFATDPEQYTRHKNHFGFKQWLATLGDTASFTTAYEATLIRIAPQPPKTPSEPLIDLIAATEQGPPEIAVDRYEQWLRCHAGHELRHIAWYNRGALLSQLGQNIAAAASFHQAIQAAPDFLPAWLNAGLTLEQSGQPDNALQLWRVAVDRDAAATEETAGHKIMILRQMARLTRHLGRVADAEHILRRCLDLAPGQRDVLQHWIAVREMRCDWPVLTPVPGLTHAALMAALSPLALAIHTNDPIYQLAHAGLSFQQDMAGKPSLATVGRWPPPEPPERPGRPLRIGYVSADLREHAIGFLTAELFELHDRGRVEVFAYYTGIAAPDALKHRIRRAVDHWIDVAGWPAKAMAKQIISDEINVLVDLAGHTGGAPVEALALRPAPVIVNWLGFPGSMGTPHHDYIIADSIIIPPEYEKYHSERVVRLSCYQPTDRKRLIADIPARGEAGLPDDAMVYCCLNGTQKITPTMFRCWMRILTHVPGSVLWLLSCDAETDARLRHRAREHGVDPDRLVFAPRLENAAHLARLPLADLFLDTFPYGAHTTASDALWLGLPVITMIGHSFASRVCASLISAAGLGELVCGTRDDYENLAVELGRRPGKLTMIRNRLRSNRHAVALFDTPRLVADLESLYEIMWDDYLNDRVPIPDQTNFAIYDEIGGAIDHETNETISLSAYERQYIDALARSALISRPRQDHRLWSTGSAPRYHSPRQEENQGKIVEHLNIIRRGNASDLVTHVDAALIQAALAQDIDSEDGFYAIEGMSGKKYRYFINRLIRNIENPRYMEIGSWAGSTLCAAIHGNHVDAIAIDNWSEFGGPKQAFLDNVTRFTTAGASVLFVEGDFRRVDYQSISPRNVYLYDGPHEEQDQYDGLSMVLPCLDRRFVFIVDDWNWQRVRKGTFSAMERLGLKPLFTAEIRTTLNNQNPEIWFRHSDWHNGYFISVLERPGTETPPGRAPGHSHHAMDGAAAVPHNHSEPARDAERLDELIRTRRPEVADLLHVGCGQYDPRKLPPFFRHAGWREIRLDIDPDVQPDFVTTVIDMSILPDGLIDALYSSHNLEHLYPHEVPRALREMHRVLRASGFLFAELPDLQEVAAHVAQGRLEDPLYHSTMGPISPLDILYGHRRSLADGNLFMAHRTGFTASTLGTALIEAGFAAVMVRRIPTAFSLAAVAFRKQPNDVLTDIARIHILPHPEQPAVLFTKGNPQ